MGKCYSQLSLEERCKIAELHQAGRSIRQIAATLDRSPSNVSRELKRNGGAQIGYRPSYAQQRAAARRWKGSRLDRNAKLRELVLERLRGGWSPEQIAGWLKRQNVLTRISHESIYRFIYQQIRRTNDGSWRHYLPRAKGKRGLRKPKRSVESIIKGRVSIASRPVEVGLRQSFGHWEADLMLFAKPGHAILVSQERKSRVVLLAKQPSKAALPAIQRLSQWLEAFPAELRRSVTFDNGTEFAHHLMLADTLGIDTYFCDPHSPWQKGTIENAIGRLRKILPRKTNLETIDKRTLEAWIAAFNNTPRKCLGFQTPAEVFLAQVLHFKCESTPSLRSG